MKKWKQGLAALMAAVMLSSTLPTMAAETNAMTETTAWMQSETVSAEEMGQLVALVPIEQEDARLDLTMYTPAELSQVKLSDILTMAGATIPSGAKVAWCLNYGDEYTVSSPEETVDISDNAYCIQCIVGSAKQLDATNVYYEIDLETSTDDWLIPTLYTQVEDGTRTQVPVLDTWYSYYTYSGESEHHKELNIDVSQNALSDDQTAYLGLALNSSLAESGRFDSAQIYAGDAAAVAAGTAEDVTARMWNVDMTALNAGYAASYDSYRGDTQFTLVLKKGETVVGQETFEVYVSRESNYVGTGSLYTETYNTSGDYTQRVYVSSRTKYSHSDDIEIETYTLYKDYAANAQYYQRFYYYKDGKRNDDAVDLAVVGNYASKDAAVAAGAADIKGTLFGDKGYLANYGGNGVIFSVFADGEVFHLQICAVDGDEPVRDSSDTYFRVQGAKEVDTSGYGSYSQDCYVLPTEHDAYCKNGFQTVLIADEKIDLSSLTPVFYTGDDVTMYAGTPATKQESEVTSQNFANGPVQYSASAGDKENVKNYWVTFVKKETSGAKLFVNGINGPKGATRELFLNSYAGTTHDIFIANVGNAPLTGLKVELSNAKNVKLDEYWTVGGTGNDTLATFDTADRDWDKHGEIPSVAKIRLLPDGDGAISGTLTISADGQTPVVITLTGVAGDPAITTTEIPAGVKYVPYGTMIQTTNMYDWNKITFKKTDGELPEGVELKSNGEIYGVPKETGSFTFTVQMSNSSNLFRNRTATYTLEVKENTAENVDASTDEGYAIQVRLPDTMTTYSNQVFEIEGVLSEFIDLWLDGEKLERGVDYLAEEGSTKNTIYSQTFQNAGAGTHTIAAEFRIDGNIDLDLKKAAQNYTSNPGASSGTASTNKPSTTTTTPTQPVIVSGTPGTYTVQQGDTMGYIALNYYGSYAYHKLLYKVNSEAFKATKGALKPGMVLSLPEQLGGATRIETPVAGEGETLYRVQAGDTLSGIAQKYYGSSKKYQAIYERNQDRLKNANTIYEGQIIVLPAK